MKNQLLLEKRLKTVTLSAGRLLSFQKKVGYCFKNQQFLHQALWHSSSGGKDFERLEFLGDRVLGAVMSFWLYELYPQACEGELTKRLAFLVSRGRVYEVGRSLHLESFLYTEKKQESARMTIVSNACEALIGAIYLDCLDWKILADVIKEWWKPFMNLDSQTPVDSKSALQELLQKNKRPLPCYDIESVSGPSHSPIFTIKVVLDGGAEFLGQAGSKQEAQQQAAKLALDFLQDKER